jgi:O-antigen/teichoic acid export membrane protein
MEAYGLVGFYSTLLGALAFADMGFTATLNRELARISARRDSTSEMRDLLRTYESIYLCMSSVLAFAIWVLAPAIAQKWLHSKGLPAHEVAAAIRLMGVAVAFQFFSGLYIGGLMGLQRQVEANVLQISWGVLRGAGAVLVLWLWSPTILVFAAWQLISNGVYCLFAHFSLWRALSFSGVQCRVRFRWLALRNTWRYAATMSTLAVVSTLLTQTDKLAVSRMLSLEILGYYSLATALAAVPSTLAAPIALAVFPCFTVLVERRDHASMRRLYHRTCKLVTVAALPAGLTIALFADNLLQAWTGSAVTARQAGLVASLLLAGQVLQVMCVVPYYVTLANNCVGLSLRLGIASVVFITPLLICLILKYGVVGAGISWLVMNTCTVPFYIYMFHRRFFPGELQSWVLRDVLPPLLAALPIVLLARLFLPVPSSRLLTLGVIGAVWCASAVAAACVMPEVRVEVVKSANRVLRVSHGA